MKAFLYRTIAIFFLLCVFPPGMPAYGDEPPTKVRFVLFYSPVCPHCHKVITEVVQPLIREVGKERLEIMGINTTTVDGNALFEAAISAYNIPQEKRGVPIVILWNYYLVGDDEIIPALPQLVKQFLEKGGAEYPPIPGLDKSIRELAAKRAQAQAKSELEQAQSAPLAVRLARDPVGNSIAILVLAAMVLVVIRSIVSVVKKTDKVAARRREWPIAVLLLVGLSASGYLAYASIFHKTTICGPLSDCNAVQQSVYSHIFGIPVAPIGVLGYLGIALIWGLAKYGNGRLLKVANRLFFALALAGTVFSMYLTFLEPFVIGATCVWCLLSALAMTGLLWCSTRSFHGPPAARSSRKASRGDRGSAKFRKQGA